MLHWTVGSVLPQCLLTVGSSPLRPRAVQLDKEEQEGSALDRELHVGRRCVVHATASVNAWGGVSVTGVGLVRAFSLGFVQLNWNQKQPVYLQSTVNVSNSSSFKGFQENLHTGLAH